TRIVWSNRLRGRAPVFGLDHRLIGQGPGLMEQIVAVAEFLSKTREGASEAQLEFALANGWANLHLKRSAFCCVRQRISEAAHTRRGFESLPRQHNVASVGGGSPRVSSFVAMLPWNQTSRAPDP